MITDFEAFLARLKKARPFLVQQKISAELLTPVRTMLCLTGLDRSLAQPQFLLESVEGGSHRARYSVIGLGANLIWQPPPTKPLDSLKRLIHQTQMKPQDAASQPPMVAGLFGYMGYDTVRLTENLPPKTKTTLGIAESTFVLPKITLVFDAVDDSVLMTAPIYPFLAEGASPSQAHPFLTAPPKTPQQLYQQTVANLKAVHNALTHPEPPSGEGVHPNAPASTQATASRNSEELKACHPSGEANPSGEATSAAAGLALSNKPPKGLRAHNNPPSGLDTASNPSPANKAPSGEANPSGEVSLSGKVAPSGKQNPSGEANPSGGANPSGKADLSPPASVSSDEFAVRSNVSEKQFKQAVLRAKQYIVDGDIFQVVLSQRFEVPFAATGFSFYRRLRTINPSPFLFFFDFGEFCVAGSSPEVMVRLRDGKTSVRPIAGTRKRGATKAEDEKLAQELLKDPKERAEHLMLLDLGRNDTSKVAKSGTVRVTEQMKVERYSHVMHMVSNVEGEVGKNTDAVDCLLAGFPAGTVSGAPKVRAMEIIDELEPIRRELYAGAVGYFSAFGEMDTCIALRTALIKDKTLYIQAGAGIVADSDPHKEFLETRNKAQALITAARDLFG